MGLSYEWHVSISEDGLVYIPGGPQVKSSRCELAKSPWISIFPVILI